MTDINHPDYTPGPFIDWLRQVFECRNDAKLALKLEITPSAISKWRKRKQPIPAHVLIAVHEHNGMKTLDIKQRMMK
jgi:hypothetical protein